MRSTGLCAAPARSAWWQAGRLASAAHNAEGPFTRPGRGLAAHERRSADGRLAGAGVRPGSGNDPPGLQGLDDGLVPGAWRRLQRYFTSRGVEEFSLDVAMAWVDEACGFFAKEQAAHAQADRRVPVQGRPDAGRLRGPRRRAAPAIPARSAGCPQARPLSSPGSGLAAGRGAERLDGAGLRDGWPRSSRGSPAPAAGWPAATPGWLGRLSLRWPATRRRPSSRSCAACGPSSGSRPGRAWPAPPRRRRSRRCRPAGRPGPVGLGRRRRGQDPGRG